MSRLRKTIVSAAAIVAGSGAAVMPVLAAITSDTGLSGTASEAGYRGAADIPSLVGGVIQGFMAALGMLFLLLIIYAGVLWMTAQGAEEKIKKAKGIIMNATVGLVLTFASYAIAGYVVDVLTTAATEQETPLRSGPQGIFNGASDPTEDLYGGCPPDDPLCNVAN